MNKLLLYIVLLFISVSGFSQNNALLQEAYKKLNSRNYEGAIQDFNKIISESPNNVEALCGRAESKIALGKNEDALKDIELVFNVDAKNPRPFILKGDILFNQKDYAIALKLYEEALLKPGVPSQAIIGKAKSLYYLGKTKEAFKYLDDEIAKFPSSADLFFSRGLLYSINQKYAKSLSDFEKAIMLNPDYNTFGLYFNRGLAYYNLEEYQNAIADFDKAVEVDPQNATAYHHLGLAYYLSEAYQEAIANFLKSSELSPNNSVTYYNLGMAYNKLEDIENACLYFHKSCQMRNTNACKMIVLTCEGK
jgi:tetratricopeptide (TPR) repeat protein